MPLAADAENERGVWRPQSWRSARPVAALVTIPFERTARRAVRVVGCCFAHRRRRAGQPASACGRRRIGPPASTSKTPATAARRVFRASARAASTEPTPGVGGSLLARRAVGVGSNPVAPAALAAGQAGLGSVPLALGHGQRPALPHRGGSGNHRRARATRHARARDGRVTGGLDLCFRDHAGLDRGVALLCGAWCRRGRTTIRRPRLALRCRRRHPIGRMRSRWSQIRVRSPSSGIDWSGKEPHCVIRAPRDPGRIAPVRTELLPAVPPRCPTVRNGRHIDQPHRLSLRHPGHEERCRRRLRVPCPQNRPRRRPPRRCAAAPT